MMRFPVPRRRRSRLASSLRPPLPRQMTLPMILRPLLDERGLRRPEMVRQAGINPTFGYQIFVGQRNPSRNKLLQLAFAMKLSLREANCLLQAAGCNELYCKNRRDAIIIFCINHGETLQTVDEQLYAFHEDTITE